MDQTIHTENEPSPTVSFNTFQVQPGINSSDIWYKASILRRLLASFLDGMILSGISIVILIPIVVIIIITHQNQYISLVNLLFYILFYGLSALWISKFGATPGKLLLKLKIVRTNYQPISFWRALLRESIGKIASSLILDLGYAWAIWDKDRQTWHDKIADTYVVTKLPDNGKNSSWIVILIIASIIITLLGIIAGVVFIAINPLELTRRARDAARLTDFDNLSQAIKVVSQEASKQNFLCNGLNPPCEGNSYSLDKDNRNSDGSGWLKMNLSQNSKVGISELPIDPTNSSIYFYRYCSDGVNWELLTTLESQQQAEKNKLNNPGSPDTYKIGTDLNLCH